MKKKFYSNFNIKKKTNFFIKTSKNMKDFIIVYNNSLIYKYNYNFNIFSKEINLSFFFHHLFI